MKIPPFAALAVAVGAFGSVPVFVRYFAWHLDAWTVNGVRYGLVVVVPVDVEHQPHAFDRVPRDERGAGVGVDQLAADQLAADLDEFMQQFVLRLEVLRHEDLGQLQRRSRMIVSFVARGRS